MGALTSMRQYNDEIATNITLGYVYELLKKFDDIPEYKSDGDIKIKSSIDLDGGFLVYSLGGQFGDLVNNPDVRIEIVPDLLRGLRRSKEAYKRHIKSIPSVNEIEPLVIKNYITTRLLGIANKYKKD